MAKNIVERFFGDTYPLARHLVQLTAIFILLLVCIYIARTIVPILFPPGEYLTKLLHVVDTYAALLGIVGYVIWLTLDMIFLLLARARKGVEEGAKRDAKVDSAE